MSTFFSIVSYIIVAAGALYVRQILYFIKGLSRLPAGHSERLHTVAVIVAARNEEANIERCLNSLLRQDYPREKYSITVVDDQSTDRTAELVQRISGWNPIVRLLRVGDRPSGISPKIHALDTGIRNTRSELVFTTDADCVVPATWISAVVKHIDENAGAVCGVTLLENGQNIPEPLFGFQFIDFFSQTACGAGAIGMNVVNNCNGSNMAFRRSAFFQVGGYASIARVNSGSDSLLAQQIALKSGWRVRFAYAPETHVVTSALTSWTELFHQRMRWAGQTPNYRLSTLLFLVASFVMYLLLFLFVPVSLVNFSHFPVPLFVLAAKVLVDYWIINKFMRLTGVGNVMRYFAYSELIHVPVILIAVFGSFFRGFEWKGRKMRREISRHAETAV